MRRIPFRRAEELVAERKGKGRRVQRRGISVGTGNRVAGQEIDQTLAGKTKKGCTHHTDGKERGVPRYEDAACDALRRRGVR